MKKQLTISLILLATTALCAFQTAPQQPTGPRTIAQILNSNFGGMEREFVPAAEAMPDNKFDFVPTQGEFKTVKTFAQQVKHVAATNYMWASSILGEKPPAGAEKDLGPDELKTKADIVKYLKDSCAYTHKALQTITADNAGVIVDGPWGGKTTRLGMGIQVTAHSFDHYGQMVEYLRMNGIIPPASRQGN